MFIHYGNDHFDSEKFAKSLLADPVWSKPNGLWASPTDTDWGWSDWCKAEDFNTDRLAKSFMFSLKEDAKVLHVRSLEDIDDYLRRGTEEEGWDGMWVLDHDKLRKDFDAMQLHISENYSLHDCLMFYTWDVDSICIWNQDAIVL